MKRAFFLLSLCFLSYTSHASAGYSFPTELIQIRCNETKGEYEITVSYNIPKAHLRLEMTQKDAPYFFLNTQASMRFDAKQDDLHFTMTGMGNVSGSRIDGIYLDLSKPLVDHLFVYMMDVRMGWADEIDMKVFKCHRLIWK